MTKFFLAVVATLALAHSPAAFAKCSNCPEGKEHAHEEQHDRCKDKKGKKAHKHGKDAKHDCKGKDCKECKDKQAKAKPTAAEPHGRIPASAADFTGNVAKLIYDGLPGSADKLPGGAFGKEGDLICYKKDDSHLCSVRVEDEETGRFEGDPAREVYEKISPDGEYEDKPGIARETPVSCVLKARKYSCDLQQ